MNKKITFKAEDLKYPSAEEIKYADSKCPKFGNFGFEDNSLIISVLQGKPVKEASIEDNLYWWDLILTNRFGSLRGAYFDSLTHFNRGFKDYFQECSDNEIINRLLFDSNAEIFYYFFFVTADVIAQILKLYFKIDIPESKVSFNEKLIKEILDPSVKEALRKFYNDTKLARDYRNGFTHRFPMNHPDYRSKIEISDKSTVLHSGSGSFIPPSKLIVNIENCLNSLSVLMEAIKKFVK